jgi:PAS domain S-box-containing protein
VPPSARRPARRHYARKLGATGPAFLVEIDEAVDAGYAGRSVGTADVAAGDPEDTRGMTERSESPIRSGDALFAFDSELTVVSWNAAAEALTGVSADDAVGRPCWDVIGGEAEDGARVCHRGCSAARLAREGWPVPCQLLHVNVRGGKRKVEVSTLAVDGGEDTLYLHLMLPVGGAPRPARDSLTSRQTEVLELLAGGLAAKEIATRLGVAETTIRSHIHAILVELGTHSQLEAVAKARRLHLVD